MPEEPDEADAKRPQRSKGYHAPKLERLGDGAMAVACSRMTFRNALGGSLALPIIALIVLIDVQLSKRSSFDLRSPQTVTVWLLVLLGLFAVPAFFVFRRRRVVLAPEGLVHQTRWPGGLRLTRLFRWSEIARVGLIDWDDLSQSRGAMTGRRGLNRIVAAENLRP